MEVKQVEWRKQNKFYGPHIMARILQVDEFCEQTKYGRERWNEEQQFPLLFVPSSNLAKLPSSFSELPPNHPGNCNLLSYALAPKTSGASQSDAIKTTPHVC